VDLAGSGGPHYVVSERRVRQGRGDALVASFRRFLEGRLNPPGREWTRILVAPDDPDRLMVLSRWRSREDYRAAIARAPRPLMEWLERESVEGVGTHHHYHSEREMVKPELRARFLSVNIARVRPERVGEWLAHAQQAQDRLAAAHDIAAVRLIEAEHDPTEFLVAIEYAEEVDGDVASALIDAGPTSPIAERSLRFFGRVEYEWERGS
jgi:hypothetical protein